VVQEALHNSARHSHATSVRIRVEQQQNRLFLNIQDDGQGFDVQHTKGLGLLGIQERVTRLGGTFQEHSQPGRGTRLSIELPVSNDAAHEPGENRNGQIRETDSHPVG
jgi:signal transduction histidine kinase